MIRDRRYLCECGRRWLAVGTYGEVAQRPHLAICPLSAESAIRRRVDEFWAIEHRADLRPLIAWALWIFTLGVLVGVGALLTTITLARAPSVHGAMSSGPVSARPSHGPNVGTVYVAADGIAARAGRGPGTPSEPETIGGAVPDGAMSAAELQSADGPLPRIAAGRGGDARTAGTAVMPPGLESPAGSARAASVPRSLMPAIIRAAAAEFGQDADRLTAVAWCESRHDSTAVGDRGAAVGLFQFHLPTWLRNAARLGYVGDLRSDPVASARVAAEMWARGQAWQWTCARATG